MSHTLVRIAGGCTLLLAPMFIASPATADDAPVPAVAMTGQEALSTPERLAALVETHYTFADQGRRIAAQVRAQAAAGAYAGLAGTALATKLREDMMTVHRDDHFNVIWEDPAIRPEDDRPSDRMLPSAGAQRPNVEGQRWLAPGIAFVRFNLFSGEPEQLEATGRFLDEYADARVLVIDLRKHRGGGLAEIEAITSRLLAEPARLVTMATRKSLVDVMGPPPTDDPHLRLVEGDPEFVTLEHWSVPDTAKPVIGARVYLLTSEKTASAAEHFALALKVTGRATLVGAHTRGANHFGSLFPIGGGLSAFVPYGRTYDPRDGKDWEGTGVASDIAVPAEDALATVLEREGLAPAEARRLSDTVAPT